MYPSEHKPEVDSEFLSWHSSKANWSKVDICEEAQRPWSARAGIRSHQIRDMGAGKAGKAAKFRKLDLTNAIIDKDLMTAAKVMEWVQTGGTAASQAFVNEHQGKLEVWIEEARAWRDAKKKAAMDNTTDIDLVREKAADPCPLKTANGQCLWDTASEYIFMKNPQINGDQLYGAIAHTIEFGPSKTGKVPLLCGPSNASKSTLVNPIEDIFGEEYVFRNPPLEGSYTLQDLTDAHRFMFLDEFRPAQYAGMKGGLDLVTQIYQKLK